MSRDLSGNTVRNLDKLLLAHETVEDRKHDLGRAMGNLYHFLNLVGFIALLLGGVGVASAIHVHVKQKLGTVAVLRCLGGSIAQTFAIYLAQGMALGLLWRQPGRGLGRGDSKCVAALLADFIPFAFQFHTAWPSVAMAVAVGFVICLLFAILPLLAVRRVSPLAALRASFETTAPQRDPLRWLVGAALALCILGFALQQSRDGRIGLGFVGGLALTGGLLTALSKGLIALTRKFGSTLRSFVWRQGLANLHRPNNRTLSLLQSLGLGTFCDGLPVFDPANAARPPDFFRQPKPTQCHPLRCAARPARAIERFDPFSAFAGAERSAHRDDAVDVSQRASGGIAPRRPEQPHAQLGIAPRISQYLQRSAASQRKTDRRPMDRPSSRRHRHRAHLLEKDIAKYLKVGIGDEIVFDVQGVPMTTRVASVRDVDWQRVEPNFYIVFPRGVLEGAPAMHALATRTVDADESARLQRAVVQAFPNVTIIDLTLVLKTLDSILSKISFVIRFMAMFTVLTGLLVLVGLLATSRYQRLEESVLLRTLGASRRQIFRILAVEYFALGTLAALTGVLLAVATAGILARFVFHEPFAWSVLPLLVALVTVPLLTVVTGLFMSRGVLDQPPLAILRAV